MVWRRETFSESDALLCREPGCREGHRHWRQAGGTERRDRFGLSRRGPAWEDQREHSKKETPT